ncbi:unnamed protein product [Owenia fusiformis]|uniref:Uncharacterized protein n=1 Tax=Owenia fusiformis TaxID=6347 RepID=A0A8J1UP31_OWEFU|nr:unnamed protein product [Owenia fusiformis]
MGILKILVLFNLLACLVGLIFAQSVENTETVQDDTSTTQVRPVDQGMQVIYLMQNFFLGIVQPKTLDDITTLIDLNSILKRNSTFGTANIQPVVLHYIGYTICAAVGVLFIIVMPLVGMIMCCCRCCCRRCGGDPNPMESKQAMCTRVVCGVLLFIFNTLLLAGMVCCFMTNELIYEQLGKSTSSGYLSDVDSSLGSVKSYMTAYVDELDSTILGGYDTTRNTIFARLDRLPAEAKDDLGGITNATELLQSATALSERTSLIIEDLDTVNTTTKALVTTTNRLSSELTSVKTDTTSSISGCSTQSCNDIRTKLSNLDVQVDYSTVDSVESVIGAIRGVLQQNFTSLIKQGQDSFDSIVAEVETKANTAINESKVQANDIRVEVVNALDTVRSFITPADGQPALIDIDAYRANISAINADVTQYGQYRWYAGLGLGAIVALIILFYYLGLAVGFCGDAKYQDSKTCDRNIGGNLMIAGVAFTFLFSWLLMLVTMLLFLPGGILKTEVCRNIYPIENEAGMKLLTDIIKTQVNTTVNISGIISNCKDNMAIYKAADLESQVDIAPYLDINSQIYQDMLSQIDKIHDVSIDLSNVNIISNDARTELQNLGNSGVGNIDFDDFRAELNKSFTSVDLGVLINDLESLATAIEGSDPATASALRTQAGRLRDINATTVAEMNTLTVDLQKAIDDLEKDVDLQSRVNNLLSHLDTAQNKITTTGSTTIVNKLTETSNFVKQEITDYVTSLSPKLQNELGKCYTLYSNLNSVAEGACENVLNPFNGFWFALGWCLFFMLPCLIIALVLVTEYRRTEQFDKYKSFEDPNYDAYNSGPANGQMGDNIPLTEKGYMPLERR